MEAFILKAIEDDYLDDLEISEEELRKRAIDAFSALDDKKRNIDNLVFKYIDDGCSGIAFFAYYDEILYYHMDDNYWWKMICNVLLNVNNDQCKYGYMTGNGDVEFILHPFDVMRENDDKIYNDPNAIDIAHLVDMEGATYLSCKHFEFDDYDIIANGNELFIELTSLNSISVRDGWGDILATLEDYLNYFTFAGYRTAYLLKNGNILIENDGGDYYSALEIRKVRHFGN